MRSRVNLHLYQVLLGVLTCAVTVIWAPREVFVHECDYYRAGKDVPVLRSRKHHHGGVHRPRCSSRPDHDGHSGCGQRLPGPARRHDHRRHVSRSRHRHGRAAPDEGLDSGREHRPYRRLHRRIGGCRRDLHHPGVRDLRRMAGLRLRARLLEVVDPDAGRRQRWAFCSSPCCAA